jgi:hypothetical protein
MMTFFKHFKTDAQLAVPQNANRISLTRAFVETGDERCPLAGIWSRLPEIDAAADDDPGLAMPAWRVLLSRALSWRAFRSYVIACS